MVAVTVALVIVDVNWNGRISKRARLEFTERTRCFTNYTSFGVILEHAQTVCTRPSLSFGGVAWRRG